jgi:hypothetical protein
MNVYSTKSTSQNSCTNSAKDQRTELCTLSRRSLLSLPIEIRLEIFKYLIPNQYPGYGHACRRDGEPCCPAILRTNRQIYNEIVDMWYGTGAFYCGVNWQRCLLFGVEFLDRRVKLPSTLRFIRTLSISVRLEPAGTRFDPWTKLLADALSAGPYSNLRLIKLSETRVYIANLGELLDSCLNNQWSYFKNMLEWNLGPLRVLRGVDLQFADIEPLYRSGNKWWIIQLARSNHDNEQAKPVFKKLKRIRQRFLEKLADEISKPKLS